MDDNEIDVVVDVDDRASDKFDEIDKRVRRMAESAGKAVKDLFDSFGRAGDRAGDANRKFASAGSGAAVLASAAAVASNAMTLLSTGAAAAGAALPFVAIGLATLAPLLSMIAALSAAAVAGLAGVGLAAGTLGIGLGGVSDAWTAYGKSAGGGGGASKAAGEQAYQAARRVEQAEEALTRAKRAAQKASEDVTRAREDERERIEDLTLALRGQKYAQEDAADAVTAAKERLARAQKYGNTNEMAAAQKELDRVQYRYDVETEKLKDLEKDKADADKKGIEGSDQVQDALERQRDALEAVTDAAEALADAQRKVGTSAGGAAGGIDQFAEAMSKLAPNAQKFVLKLIELKERFAGVKREVQNRLFAGLDDTLEKIANAWGPKAVDIFGGMADALNRVAKAIGSAFADNEFVDNMEKAGDSFERFLDSLGEAATSIIDAFGRIAAAGGPVLEKVGRGIADLAESFAEWIKAADESGQLESFLEKGAGYLKDIWEIGGLAFDILKEFIKILFPSSDAVGGGVLDGIKEALQDVKDWMGDPENQQQIKDMFRNFGRFFEKLVNEWIPAIEDFADSMSGLLKPIGRVIGWLERLGKWLTVTLPAAISAMSKRGGNIFNGVKDGFRNALNWIIDRWNSLNFTLPSVSIFGQQIGGGTIGTSHIDRFARGGIANGLAIVGENGPELAKLPTGSQVLTHGDSMRTLAGQGGGGGTLRVVVERSTERGLIDALFGMLRFEIDRSYGGDVQRALGSTR